MPECYYLNLQTTTNTLSPHAKIHTHVARKREEVGRKNLISQILKCTLFYGSNT